MEGGTASPRIYFGNSYQVRDALGAMRAETELPLAVVSADEGPTVSAFLMQFTADVTGVDPRVSGVAECSALGAVMAARIGLSEITSPTQWVGAVSDARVYRPQREEREILRCHAGWRRAVAQVRSEPAMDC